MSALPPVELARLDVSGLQSPGDTPLRFPRFSLSVSSQTVRAVFAPSRVLSLLLFFCLPTLVFLLTQPRQPTLASGQRELVSAYIQEQTQTAIASSDVPPLPSPTPSESVIDLVASQKNTNAYAYHLSLAQSFLQKAVELSRTTAATGQTDLEQQKILSTIDQAMKAANQAIELDPRQGAGFLVRARIYKTAATLQPELSAMSEQDLTIARALGVDANALTSDEPLDLLPTQQASELASAPVVADAEEGSSSSVTGQTGSNATRGSIVMRAGESAVFVSAPGLLDSWQITVTAAAGENSTNAVFRVASRTQGSGFILSTSDPLARDVTLEWQAIPQ